MKTVVFMKLLPHGPSVIMSASHVSSGLFMVKYRKWRQDCVWSSTGSDVRTAYGQVQEVTSGMLGGWSFVAPKSRDHHYVSSVVTKFVFCQSAVKRPADVCWKSVSIHPPVAAVRTCQIYFVVKSGVSQLSDQVLTGVNRCSPTVTSLPLFRLWTNRPLL